LLIKGDRLKILGLRASLSSQEFFDHPADDQRKTKKDQYAHGFMMA